MFAKKSTRDLVSGGAEDEPIPKKRGKKSKQRISVGKPSNRIFLGAVCVVVALFIAFGLTPLANRITTEEVSALRLLKDVPKGSLLQNDMFQVVRVNDKNLSPGLLHDAQDALGQYAAFDLTSGDLLTDRKITASLQYDDPYLSDLPEGKIALSVTMQSNAESLSSKLRAGDIVRLFYFEDEQDKGNYVATALPELQYVEVLAVTNTRMRDLDTKNENLSENEEKTISTLTLAVNDQQAAVLVGLNQAARLHAALVTRGKEAEKQAVLAAQEEYFQVPLPVGEAETEPQSEIEPQSETKPQSKTE